MSSSPSKARARRGQNLVLFALTMLLMVLFVTMTLGIASRVRENHELQTLADVAAYSNAVVNARAYNDIAIINRLQVSYWVAVAADESLISWTAYARALMNAADRELLRMSSTAGDGCAANNNEASNARSKLNSLRPTIINPSWVTDDIAAGQEAKAIQGMIAGLRGETRDDPDGMLRRVREEREQQTLAQQIVNNAGLIPGTVSVISGPTPTSDLGPQGVSRREVGCKDIVAADPEGPFRGTGSGSGLCGRSEWNLNLLHAALGTREHAFTRFRGEIPSSVQGIFTAVNAAVPEATLVPTGPVGSGYFGAALDHGAAPDTTIAFADDDGSLTVTVGDSAGGCSRNGTVGARSWVRSTHIGDGSDQHEFLPGAVGLPDVPDVNHTMGSCGGSCPSVWVRAVMFLPSNRGESDAYGQPKNYAALERNYAHPAMKRPWELDFTFFFRSAGPGTRFDNRGEELHG
ncbi:MAG: hypothetical protein H6Q89_2357, partial [Myxococcaceae bacterium]|nr:hypothetical protein [Myxococcaceae bacterium]